MKQLVSLHSKEVIEAFARRNPYVHAYLLGDLDDFYWPQTTWYALEESTQARQLALLYAGCSMPTMLALAEPPAGEMHDLLRRLLPLLPRRFYAHLTPEVVSALEEHYQVRSHGLFWKMGLIDPSRLAAVDASRAEVLLAAETAEVERLYRAGYPGNWFVPRMLETGFYFGVREGGVLASVAGIHVFSPAHRVAALGNITTHPDFRGRGLATAVTAKLCQELLHAGVTHVGLNVRKDNASAVACYEKLGFQPVAEYGEYTVEAK